MYKWFCLFSIVMLLNGCSANKEIVKELNQSLAPAKQYSQDALSVEEIAKLKPQITPPIKIAVTQPGYSGYSRYGYSSNEWSSTELQEIESWQLGLKSSGFASELVVIPSSLVSSCVRTLKNDCDTQAYRLAAARLHADAVLVIERAEKIDSYLNPLSILNITIVGMWVVPAHHRDSYSLFQAYLVDTANGYIYGTARAEGMANSVRPFMYTNDGAVLREASLNGLKALGKKINEIALQAMVRSSAK